MDANDWNALLMAVAERAVTEFTDESIYGSSPARSNNGESAEVANTVNQHGCGFEPGGTIVEGSNPNSSQIENAMLANKLDVISGPAQGSEVEKRELMMDGTV